MVSVGDWVYVKQYRSGSRIPADCLERIGKCISVTDRHVTLTYKNGVMIDGEKHDSITLVHMTPEKSKRQMWCLITVEPLDCGYDVGPNGGQMIPTELMMERNKKTYDHPSYKALVEKRHKPIWADIKESGLRHPVVVTLDLTVQAGTSRLYAHHKAGTETVECFVIDKTKEQLTKRGVKPADVGNRVKLSKGYLPRKQKRGLTGKSGEQDR